MSHNQLTSQQQQVATLLAIGNKSIKEIADSGICSRASIYNWKELPHFNDEVHRIRQEAENFALTMYYNNLANAVKNLKKLGDESENDMVKLNANKEFVDRILGKPTNNHNINQTNTSDKNVDPDEAQNVFDQVVNEETSED
ncbi:hypothetical protein MOF37_17185 [Bacillus spizizenii]|nr:hypothetical protein [Bacillus spizizenii]MCY9431075.1 hypothetical protein [Bacillus spizizenii]